jgi:hypothetical protein
MEGISAELVQGLRPRQSHHSLGFRKCVSVLRNNLSFDAANRITQIADPANPTLQNTDQYDAVDRLAVVQKGNPIAS